MKKTLLVSVLLLFMSMTGATALANTTSECQEQYPEYVSAMNEAFENGYYYWYDGHTLKDVPYGWSHVQFATDMINSVWWDIKPSDAETQKVIDAYGLQQNYCVYDKSLLEQVIKYKFNLSVGEIAQKAQKEWPEGIIETDNYWLIMSCGRGEVWPGSYMVIDSFEKINHDVVYAKWHYENPYDNYVDRSDAYYAILEKGSIAGKQLVRYQYIGVVPPSDALIARCGYNLGGICEAYINIISEYDYYTESDIISSICYYIYDIDKDGTPELIINDQMLPSSSGIDIYTYKDDEAVFLEYMDGGRVKFYTYPGNGFAVSYTMDGYGTMDLISIVDDSLEVTQTWKVQKFNELALLPHGAEELTGCEYSAKTFEINYDYIKNAIASQNSTENLYSDIKVLLNGREIAFDQPPIIRDDRTLVPMRAIFEAMGCVVEWDDGMIDVWKGDKNIMTLWIDDTEMWLPGGNIILDVPPQIVNDRTLVPVRAISESMGADVEWDGNSRTVKISMHSKYPGNSSVIETD